MASEALRELNALSAESQAREDVLQMRLFVQMRARHWDESLDVCAKLRKHFPSCTTGYIHGAFCLHEMDRTREARDLLLSGPADLLREPTYHYNLGCYDAVLGNVEEAARHLEISFQMDKKFREIAKYDPDLNAVKDFL